MTVTIEELERMCAASGSIRKVAKNIGVTHQCVSARLIRSRETREFISSLNKGDMLREKLTGHRWQYMGPSARSLDSVRVATEGGAHQMDMSASKLERIQRDPYGDSPTADDRGNFSICKHIFSWEPGTYGPHTQENTALIERAMEVRRALDRKKEELMKADPVANLLATTKRKAEAKKQLAE